MQNRDIIESLDIEIVEEIRGELRCLCPFHDDNKPSFNVNILTGAWQCWSGCARGKDIYSLVAKKLNISYSAAKLEIEKGFSPAVWLTSFKRKLLAKSQEEKESIVDVELINSLPLAIGNEAETYLNKRGYNKNSIEFWGILHCEKENAIIIPIKSDSKKLIGYLFRNIKEKKFKYNYGFKAGRYIFGLDKLDKQYKIINIVEGLLDTIWCWQNGFENTVSTFTCNVSDEQAVILAGLAPQINIIYDSDLSGYSAAKEAARKLRELNVITKIVLLPKGKDPNDCSKEEIAFAIEKAKYSFLTKE